MSSVINTQTSHSVLLISHKRLPCVEKTTTESRIVWIVCYQHVLDTLVVECWIWGQEVRSQVLRHAIGDINMDPVVPFFTTQT